MDRDDEEVLRSTRSVGIRQQAAVVVQRESGAEITFRHAHLYVDGDERKIHVMREEDTLGIFAIDDVRAIYVDEVE